MSTGAEASTADRPRPKTFTWSASLKIETTHPAMGLADGGQREALGAGPGAGGLAVHAGNHPDPMCCWGRCQGLATLPLLCPGPPAPGSMCVWPHGSPGVRHDSTCSQRCGPGHAVLTSPGARSLTGSSNTLRAVAPGLTDDRGPSCRLGVDSGQIRPQSG